MVSGSRRRPRPRNRQLTFVKHAAIRIEDEEEDEHGYDDEIPSSCVSPAQISMVKSEIKYG